MGERSIAPMGHVKMMAAIQPFVSGALSKTVNLPAEATVEDVEDVYFQGWKLGPQGARDLPQQLQGRPAAVEQEGQREGRRRSARSVVEYRPVRKRLPKKRPSQTVSFSVAGAEGYMTAGSYPDDGLGEVFIKMSKQGSTLAGVMDAFSVAISIGLQYGVPLEAYVSKFTNMRFDPAGMTDDPDVRIAQSVMDYLFRRLALDYLPYEKRAELGIFSAEERAATGRRRTALRRRLEDEVDVEGLAHVGAGRRLPVRVGGAGRGALVDRAARGAAGDGGRRAALHDLRREDAAGRQLLRVRELREHQRLQLVGVGETDARLGGPPQRVWLADPTDASRTSTAATSDSCSQ